MFIPTPCGNGLYKPSPNYLCSTKYHTWISTDQREGTGQRKFNATDIKCTVGAGLQATPTEEFAKNLEEGIRFPLNGD